jgi:hypothetical protein
MGKQEKSSWDTETGLLDDFDFEIDEAWFGEDEEADNADGRIFLFVRGTATDAEGEEHEEHRERYSTGKNWEAVDDGAEVENATGKNRFNESTGLGRFINALVGLGDDEATFLSKRGQAYEASTFDGLEMHMENMVASTWKDDDGVDVIWRLNLPVELTIPKPKKAKKGGKGKADRSPAKKSKKVSGLKAEIAKFAAQFESDEHDEFVDQILDEDVFDNANKIMDDDELHAEVLDPDSELWANAHK